MNKFRVWNNNENEYDDRGWAITDNGKLGWVYGYNELDTHSFENNDNYIVEWYTGLKDKNGVEIYEGDIFDIHQTVNGCNLFEVVWDDIGWSAKYAVKMVKPRLYEYDLKELFDVNYNEKYPYEIEIEVVGNIHEKIK